MIVLMMALAGSLPAASQWMSEPLPPAASDVEALMEQDSDQALLLFIRTGWIPDDSVLVSRVREMALLRGRTGRLASWACTVCGIRPETALSPGLVELGPETVLPDLAEARRSPDLVHAALLRALHSVSGPTEMQLPQDAVELALACWPQLPDSTKRLALEAAGRFEVAVPEEKGAGMGLSWTRYCAESGLSLPASESRSRGLQALYLVSCLPDSGLKGMMEHPDWFVRHAVGEALPAEDLRPMLDDPVAYVGLTAAMRLHDEGIAEGGEALRALARRPGPVGDMAAAELTAEDSDLLEELLTSSRPARRAAAQSAWLEYGLAVDVHLARSWETDPYWIVPVSWVYHLEQSGELGRARRAAERIAEAAEESDNPERLLSFLEEIVTGGPAGAVEEADAWPGAELPYDPGNLSRPEHTVLKTSEGEIVLELLWDAAPIACANLVHLAGSGFYDNIYFHRVVPGFVAQAGCPEGNGMGGPGYTIPGEPSLVPFRRGAVGMADAGPGTAGSQFFIMLDSHRRLDARYTAFAMVVQGMEAAERLTVGSEIESVEIR